MLITITIITVAAPRPATSRFGGGGLDEFRWPRGPHSRAARGPEMARWGCRVYVYFHYSHSAKKQRYTLYNHKLCYWIAPMSFEALLM